MVDNVDAQDAANLNHRAGKFSILRTRFRVAGWMVVHKHHSAGVDGHSRGEHLTGVDRNMGDCAYGNDLKGYKAEPDIE